MKILPVLFQEAKDSDNPFLISLLTLYLKNTTLYFAIADRDIPFVGNNYTAFPVEIAAAKQTVDSKIDNVELTISNVNDEFSSALFNGYDFRGCRIVLQEIMYPEALEDPTLFRYQFYGTMDAPSLDCKDATFKVTCKAGIPNINTGRNTGLACNSIFGDESCGKTKDTVTGTTQGTSTTHDIFIQQSKPDNYWNNGIIMINYEARQIKASVDNKITVAYPFVSSTANKSYSISNGCGKTTEECDRHNNRANYSGFIAIPFEMIIKG